MTYTEMIITFCALFGPILAFLGGRVYEKRRADADVAAAFESARAQVDQFTKEATSCLRAVPAPTTVARWRAATSEASAVLLQVSELIDAGDIVVRPGRGVRKRRRDLDALASVCLDRGHELCVVGITRNPNQTLGASLEEHTSTERA